MAKVEAKTQLSAQASSFLESLPKEIVAKVFPKVLNKFVRPIQTVLRQKLPDSNLTGTRKKQSDASRKRFPNKLNKQVASKTTRDELGVLKIIGVRVPEGNVINFDFGDKAKGAGRNHIYWGRRPKPQVLRKQIRNIPLELESQFAGPFQATFVAEMKKAIKKEKL